MEQNADRFLDGTIDREDLRFYVNRLLDLCANGEARAYKAISLAAALAALFLLLLTQNVAEAELFGVKLERFGFFLLVIPVAIAFQFSRAMAFAVDASFYRGAYEEITKRQYENWNASAFDRILVEEPGPLSLAIPPQFVEGKLANGTDAAGDRIYMLLVPAAPAGFNIYAYIQLFASPLVSTAWAIVSALISTVLIVLGWSFYRVLFQR
jgi:hypothetical protein